MQKRTQAFRKNLQTTKIKRSLTAYQRDWLIDTQSLTEKMSQESDKDFSVQCLKPWQNSQRQKQLQRRVILFYKGKPWVYAESSLARRGLGWRQHYLRLLGERSIGTRVIQKFRLPKRVFRPEMLDSNTAIMKRLQAATGEQTKCLWSRHAEYHWGKHILTVKEVFLPSSKMLGLSSDDNFDRQVMATNG